MPLVNNEYYYENTAGIILSQKGRSVIEAEIEKYKPMCAKCAAELILITMTEGDFVICPTGMYEHKNSWRVIHGPLHLKPPTLSIIDKEN